MAYPYITVSDLSPLIDQTRLIALTDDSGQKVVDQTVIDGAILFAEGQVDSALSSAGISTPVVTPDPYIKGLTAVLAVQVLYIRRPAVTVPDSLKSIIKWAEGELKAIAAKDRPVGATGLTSGGVVTLADTDRGWNAAELF